MFALEQTFVHAIRFENLAAIEAYQEKQQGDAAFQAVGRKITQCLSRPQAVVLYETLLTTGAATNPKFLISNRLSPAPGKAAELRDAFEERMKKGPPAGAASAALSQQIASIDGPAFSVTLAFASMAAIDEYRAATAKDSGFQTFVSRVAALTRTPAQQRMARILIPFPS